MTSSCPRVVLGVLSLALAGCPNSSSSERASATPEAGGLAMRTFI